MPFQIPVGVESFEEIRSDHSYYVDKTEMIYELVGKRKNKVSLFTRPRRFGKTLMMSTIESFFDVRRNSADLFRGLNIVKHPEFCREWMNQYPVLFMSLKSVDGSCFRDAYAMLESTISDLCIKFSFLLKESASDPADREVLQKLISRRAEKEEIKNSLRILMRMLFAVYGKPSVLLIDEYDVPLAKSSEAAGKDPEWYPLMLEVIRGLFDGALKTNEYLRFAVITGCLRIAKESIFTGTNNFVSYSVLDDDFSEYFGFTEKEVDDLLAAAGRSEKSGVLKKWYDGYLFGDTHIYCPWDVVSYVSQLLSRRDAVPKNYWKNTSHNAILRTFVEQTDFRVNGKFETLLNGGQIRQTISDELTYDTLHESEENLWSVLVMTGYLTKASVGEGSAVDLKIPNEEIQQIFRDTVVEWFKDHRDRSKLEELMDAFWTGNEKKASEVLTDFLYHTISYHDYHEEYYKVFLAGLISGIGYETSCEDENGLGRTDTDIKDYSHKRAIILEDKLAEDEDGMEKACQDALDQIVQKEYICGFEAFDTVLCYGIAFWKKKALVKKL